MAYYRKTPVVIEAHRLGDDGWPDAIWEGVNHNQIILHLDRIGFPPKVTGYVEIRTLEGVMRAEIGDWIIKGVKGEFYPCKPDIFEATYEPADAMIAEREGLMSDAPERIGLISNLFGEWALAHREEADNAVHYVRADLHDVLRARIAELEAVLGTARDETLDAVERDRDQQREEGTW